jgi:hypothetical protein
MWLDNAILMHFHEHLELKQQKRHKLFASRSTLRTLQYNALVVVKQNLTAGERKGEGEMKERGK